MDNKLKILSEPIKNGATTAVRREHGGDGGRRSRSRGGAGGSVVAEEGISMAFASSPAVSSQISLVLSG